MNISDQKSHWDILHKQGALKAFSDNPTNFAKEITKYIPPNSKILELGCGLGNDSYYFAKQRHAVIATDFSDEAIKQNNEKYKDARRLTFKVMDMNKSPYPFKENDFDCVYSRLSLHYFSDEITRKIVKEVFRILKHNGLLFFLCKSTGDPLYGKGRLIEKDMYEFNGHIRHFFSKDYSKDLLKGKFRILKLESGMEDFYGEKSGYIKVIAKKEI